MIYHNVTGWIIKMVQCENSCHILFGVKGYNNGYLDYNNRNIKKTITLLTFYHRETK